jgi:Mu-like prophage major head subunit gpT
MAYGIGVAGAFSQAIIRDFTHVFFDHYVRQDAEHDKVANFGQADGNYLREGQIATFGAMQNLLEGQAVPWEIYKQGKEKTVYFTPIGTGVQITQVLMDDDRQDIIKSIPVQLAKAAAYTKEVKFWDIFNNGFGTAARVGIDGVALFSTAHPRIDYGTNGINNTTAAALSETALTAAINTFEALVNEKGIPIKVKPKLLIIPWQLKWMAKRLLLSELRTQVTDNDMNPLMGEDLQYMVCHYLTSQTAWFLIGETHDLRFIWRKQLAVENSDDFNTGNALFKITGRLACDFFDWTGVFGNAGA